MQLFNDAKICLAVCSDLGNNRNSNKRIHQQHSKIRYQECKIPWSSFASFLCLWMVSSNDDSSSSSAMFAEIAEIVLHNALHEISKNRRSTWVKTQFITRPPPDLSRTSHQRRENLWEVTSQLIIGSTYGPSKIAKPAVFQAVLRGIGKSFQSAITAPRMNLTGYGNATAQS